MAVDFVMPKLGLTMEEGTIVEWLVPDGAVVTAGAPVLTIETDKVETQVEASATGRLVQSGAVGQTFACGVVIGAILAVDGAPPPPPRPAPPAAAAVVAVPSGPATTPDRRAPAGAGRRAISPNARR